MDEVVAGFFLAEVFQRICPENIAHKAVGRRFSKSINLVKLAWVSLDMHAFLVPTTYRFDIFQGMQFGTQPSVDAEELLVHDRRQRQRAK